jgi:hypothetical protein
VDEFYDDADLDAGSDICSDENFEGPDDMIALDDSMDDTSADELPDNADMDTNADISSHELSDSSDDLEEINGMTEVEPDKVLEDATEVALAAEPMDTPQDAAEDMPSETIDTFCDMPGDDSTNVIDDIPGTEPEDVSENINETEPGNEDYLENCGLASDELEYAKLEDDSPGYEDSDDIGWDSEPEHPDLHLPTEKTGEFSGQPGESEFSPNSSDALDKMSEFGRETVEYKNGYPDFTPFKEQSSPWGKVDSLVEIGHMNDSRNNPKWEFGKRQDAYDLSTEPGNFAQADVALAERIKDQYPDITPSDVSRYRKDSGLTWHEYADGKSMQLVPREIHDACKHSGGVSEMKYRMSWGDVDKHFEGEK